MRKNLLAVIFGILFVLPGFAMASVITVVHDEMLPPAGTEYYDLDADGTLDLGLAEDCCTDERLWINGTGLPSGVDTEWDFAFVGLGDIVDASLDWVSGVMGYTVDLIIGEMYVATRDTSIGDYFGYMTISFDGTDTFLREYSYEDSGRSIQVPEPSIIALLGLGLIGLGFARRKVRS